MEEILTVLKNDYGYQGSEELKEHPIPTFNRVFYVGDQFFVKLSKAGLLGSEDVYAARLETVKQMGAKGIAVPHIVQTKEVKNYVRLGDHNLEVHRYIQNIEHFQGSSTQLGEVARNVARYHLCLDQLKGSHIELLRRTKSPFERTFAANGFDVLLQSYIERLSEIPHPELRNHLKKALPVLRERYKEILEEEISDELDKGLVHGDLHNEQMLFDSTTGDLVAFIDWEGLHFRPRAFDIGYTVERLTTDVPRIHDSSVPIDSLFHNPRKVSTFLETYSSERDLSDHDIEASVDHLLVECVRRGASILGNIYSGISEGWEDINLDKMLLYMRIMSIDRTEELRKHL